MAIIEKIIDIIKLEVDDEHKDVEITADTDLKDDLYFNSLNIVVVINEIEEEYDIQFDYNEIQNVRTVKEIVNMINKLL